MSLKSLLLATAAAALLPTGAAFGATLTPECTEYQNSALPANCPTLAPTVVTLSTPGLYGYSDLSLQSASGTGGTITGSNYPGGYPGASFYDAFVIRITGSQADSLSTTLNLGQLLQVTNFQERLYPLTSGAPTVGPVADAVDFWTVPVAGLGTVAVLPTKVLIPGTYVLEVRGDVTGTAGGAYAGALQLSPVPLPPGFSLLASGLMGLAILARGRLPVRPGDLIPSVRPERPRLGPG
jgi:hypothetical protein